MHHNKKYDLKTANYKFLKSGYILLATEYKNVKYKMPCICKNHEDKGIIYKSLDSINKGAGCKWCNIENNAIARTYTTELAISKIINRHDGFYAYPNFVYSGSQRKINIFCPLHGDFEQVYSIHLSGVGCPKCARENSGFKRSDWINMAKKSKTFDSYKLYKIRCFNDYENFYKIGITFCTIDYRFTNNIKMPYNYEIIEIIESDDGEYIWNLEKELHRKHSNYKYLPEIEFIGMHECFTKLI